MSHEIKNAVALLIVKRLAALALLTACNVNVAVQPPSSTAKPDAALPAPPSDDKPLPPPTTPPVAIVDPEPIQGAIDLVTPKERRIEAVNAFNVQDLSVFNDDAPFQRRPISAVWPGLVEELAIESEAVHLIIDGVHYRLDRLSDVSGKVRADDPTDNAPAWLYIDQITWVNDYSATARLCIDQVYSCRTVTTVLSE